MSAETKLTRWVGLEINILGIAAVLLLLGTASVGKVNAADTMVLIDPTPDFRTEWLERSTGSKALYEIAFVDGVRAIRADASPGAASGLYRDVDLDLAAHPWIEWLWRVDEIQRSADIRSSKFDDFAAALFFIFRPQASIEKTTALAYVWTNATLPRGTFVSSPRSPETIRFVVVEAGEANLGKWITSLRNVRDDYHVAFGKEAPNFLDSIALWTDADQTMERALAYYGAAVARLMR